MDSAVPKRWIIEQLVLKSMIELPDRDDILQSLQYVIGFDISYIKERPDEAVCTGVIMDYSDWSVKDQETIEVKITEPYKAGYLAFREIDHYIKVYGNLVNRNTECTAHNTVCVTDGNGILHPKGFGLASHLGVLLNMPTFGCGKNLHVIDDLARNRKEINVEMKTLGVDELPMVGKSGRMYGYAMLGPNNTNAVYFSQGHMMSLCTMKEIARKALIYREPEPTRIADRVSREYIRTNSGT